MADIGWRYCLASVIGTSHTGSETPCQDASQCSVFSESGAGEVLVAVVSDGAGSASHSQIGAELACALFLCEMETYFGGGGTVEGLNHEFLTQWIEHYQGEVSVRAAAAGQIPRDYAATFLAAIIGERHAAFAQVGDGVIVVADASAPDEYALVYPPQRGEYANTTYFLTGSDAKERLLFDCVPVAIRAVSLLTDGLERLAIDFKNETGHAPFFRPMFAPLKKVEPGHAEKLSRSLGAFLGSKSVNERTDDDKTLILATRGEPTEGEASPGDAV